MSANESVHAGLGTLENDAVMGEFDQRPWRTPDDVAESRALLILAEKASASPEQILQQVATVAAELCRVNSAAVVLVDTDQSNYHWETGVGKVAPYLVNAGSSAGQVLHLLQENDSVRLFADARAVAPELLLTGLPVHENILIPWTVKGRHVGALWVVALETDHHFDAEDVRVLQSVLRFAAALWGVSENARLAKDLQAERRAALNLMEDAVAARESERRENVDRRRIEEELRAAESGLRASENRLRTLSDVVPQIIWTNDGPGFADYFNQRWYEYTGLNLPQSMGAGWQVVVHPDDAAPSGRKWAAALQGGKTFEVEYRLRRADGAYRWFIGRNVPLLDSQGAVASWFGTATDIHELKEAQAVAREKEEQFRRAIEDAPIPVIMHADDGEVLALSREWTALTGYTRTELGTVDAWLSTAQGIGVSAVRERMGRIFSGEGGSDEIEFEIVTRTGEHRYWLFSISAPGTLRDGRRFAVGMAVDVTGRKRAEQALANSREWLRLIVESAQEHAILSADLNRVVTSWNTGAERVLGYTAEEMIGRLADSIFTPEDRADGIPEKESDSALISGRAADERWHLRKDGSRFWGSGVMMPMRSASDGNIVGFVKIFRDETEKREAVEALKSSRAGLEDSLKETERARAEAQAATEAKDRFIAVLSHELRTPLTPVLMAAQVLARRKDLPEPVRDAVGMIRSNVQLEARLIDDLLDVTRIASGKMELNLAELDLHDVVKRAADIIRPEMEVKEQVLGLRLEAGATSMVGDATRLQQVVWNLLKNASKFTPQGGHVEVATSNDGLFFILSVTDSGIGIEAEALGRIFEAFTQASTGITREFGGLGLGLSISRAIAVAHQGELFASSRGLNCGATFTARIPLV